MATTGCLTEEQKRRMEDNRKRAVLLRAKRSQGNNQVPTPAQTSSSSSASNSHQDVGKAANKFHLQTSNQTTSGVQTTSGINRASVITRPGSLQTKESNKFVNSTQTDWSKKSNSDSTKPSSLPTKSSSKFANTNQMACTSSSKESCASATVDASHKFQNAASFSNAMSTTEGSLPGGLSESSSSSSSNGLNKQKTISSFYSTKPKSASGGPASLSAHSKKPASGFQARSEQVPQAPSRRPDFSQKGGVTNNKPTFVNAQGMNSQSALSGSKGGTCALISRDRFVVSVGFHAKLIDVFKEIPSKNYDAAEKKWSFALSDYDTLMEAVKPLCPSVEIEPLPKTICTAFRRQRHGREGHRTVPDANLKSVDEKLVHSLMGFQREGVNFAISREGRVLIADEMGLGKTLQAICVACYYRAEWPVLVVSPSSVRYSWAEAFEKWMPSLDPDDINVVLNSKSSATSGKVNIVSYDLMHRKAQELKQFRFQVVIMDECHFLKNIKTARTKAALPLMKTAPRVILLSGTPALSRPSELYTQILGVSPRLFSSFHEFGLRYCNATQNPWGWDYSGSSNMSELQLLLEECIMIRRLKHNVIKELPSKTRQMVIMDPSVVKTTSKALKNAADKMGTNKSKSDDRGLLLKYFAETGLVKAPAIRDYIQDLLEAGHKFLVFAHHQTVLDALSAAISQKKYEFIRIDGSTSALQRKACCDRFQQDEACRAAVLSITAANAGLTLTSASMVVFAELFWNPGILVQAEDRVHRIGQQDSVNIKYLIAKGTADDYIWPLVQQKLAVLGKAGLSKDDFSEASTTAFKDPRQKSILSFFQTSFLDDEESEREDLACLVAMESQESEDGINSPRTSATEERAERTDSRIPACLTSVDDQDSTEAVPLLTSIQKTVALVTAKSKHPEGLKSQCSDADSNPSVIPMKKSKTLFSTPWASKKPLTEPNGSSEDVDLSGPPSKRQKSTK